MKRMLIACVAVLLFSAAGCGGGGPGPAWDALTSIMPADGATGIPVTQVITAQFNADLNESTLTSTNIKLSRAGTIDVPGVIVYDAATRTLTFTPDSPMLAGTLYTYTIGAGAQTKAAGDHAITFTTQEMPLLYAFSEDTGTYPVNIWSMDPDGTDQTNLTAFTDKAVATANGVVARSPDLTKIAFLAMSGDPSDRTNLYVMNADGSGLMNLTNGGADYEAVSLIWAPDSSRIYFIFRPDGTSPSDLASVKPDGTELTNLTDLTSPMEVIAYPFHITPDGARLLYSAGDPANPATVPINVYIMNSDGTGNTMLTNVGATEKALTPIFSADGQKIYYSAGVLTSGYGLYSMNLDGTGQQTIVSPVAGRAIWPWAFSPDNTQLVAMFYAGPPNTGDIYIISADGATLTQLTTLSGSNSGWAGLWSWSPDGSKIAYIYGDVSAGPADLFVADRDGSGAINITNYSGNIMVYLYDMFAMLGTGTAQWSPDQTRLAFSRKVDLGANDKIDVMIGNADGSGITALTDVTVPQMAGFAEW